MSENHNGGIFLTHSVEIWNKERANW